jgi:HAMP domain-containing protein
MTRTVERSDGVTTERVTEDSTGGPTYVEAPSSGSGFGGVLAVIAVIAALAIAAFFFLNMNRNDNLRTSAVQDAAGSVSSSASRAADSVGSAAQSAGEAVNPSR